MKSIGARIATSYVIVLICTMVVFMAGTAVVLFLQMRAQLGTTRFRTSKRSKA